MPSTHLSPRKSDATNYDAERWRCVVLLSSSYGPDGCGMEQIRLTKFAVRYAYGRRLFPGNYSRIIRGSGEAISPVMHGDYSPRLRLGGRGKRWLFWWLGCDGRNLNPLILSFSLREKGRKCGVPRGFLVNSWVRYEGLINPPGSAWLHPGHVWATRGRDDCFQVGVAKAEILIPSPRPSTPAGHRGPGGRGRTRVSCWPACG